MEKMLQWGSCYYFRSGEGNWRGDTEMLMLTFTNSLFHSPKEWGYGTKISIPKSEMVAAGHPAPPHSK